MTAYRIADTAADALPWLGRVKPAFARARTRAGIRVFGGIGAGLAAFAATVLVSMFVNGIAVFGLLLIAVALKISSVRSKLHDPTRVLDRFRSNDLVAWAEAVAEREGQLVVGSALANMLFGLAAEKEGGLQPALELYSEAARDVSNLHPEPLIERIATVVCVRGAIVASQRGDLASARELIAVLDRVRSKHEPENLRRLPAINPSDYAGDLTKNIDAAERVARKLAAGETSTTTTTTTTTTSSASSEQSEEDVDVHLSEDALESKEAR